MQVILALGLDLLMLSLADTVIGLIAHFSMANLSVVVLYVCAATYDQVHVYVADTSNQVPVYI